MFFVSGHHVVSSTMAATNSVVRKHISGFPLTSLFWTICLVSVFLNGFFIFHFSNSSFSEDAAEEVSTHSPPAMLTTFRQPRKHRIYLDTVPPIAAVSAAQQSQDKEQEEGEEQEEKLEKPEEKLEKPVNEKKGEKEEKQQPAAKNDQITQTEVAKDTLSACLLIKDDNEILDEWIAYHYHVLDLRYLIVAVDPSSETSPSHILQKWETITASMGAKLHILQWSDQDFMPRDLLKKGYHYSPRLLPTHANASQWHEGHEDPEQVIADNIRIQTHRFRQVTFLSVCLRHIRDMNRTWTMHIDTDEYIVVNPRLRHQRVRYPTLQIPQRPRDASSLMNVLRKIHEHKRVRKNSNYPCISMPRLLFGSVEKDYGHRKTIAEIWNRTVGDVLLLNSSAHPPLETLRWKYHTNYTDTDRNAQPKVLIDVSAVPGNDEMFTPKPFSIHRPSKKLCRPLRDIVFGAIEKFPLSVQHYLGSRERYFARNDTRRSLRRYESKAAVQAGSDDWIVPWWEGFVQRVGRDRAIELLSLSRP